MEQQNILVTGLPGTGKTTVITRLAERFKGFAIAGFYTEELRAGGARKGFEIVDVRGGRVLLSHVDIQGGQRVGKYGVDIAGFERYLEGVSFLSGSTDLIIIDEIGKMECLSSLFRRLVIRVLDAPVLTAATIALHGGGIIENIKKREDVRLFELTRENRDELVGVVEKALKAMLAASGRS